MARVLSTVWAFLLHIIGVTIFQTCFSNAMEDWDGNPLLTGPPITSFFFAFGIYIIILRISLFPSTFRKLQIALLSIYEFLATAFFLEFATACIWSPIDIIIMVTLPRKICQILANFGYVGIGKWISTNKIPTHILCYVVSLAFFFISLHTTGSLEFSILQECGVSSFVTHVKNTLCDRILSELPTKRENRSCGCRNRENRRRRNNNSNFSFSDDY